MNKHQIRPIALAVAALFFTTHQAQAENKAEALETEKIEVVGTTPLPSIGTPISQVPYNVQTGSAKNIEQQQSLDLSDYLDNNLGSVNTSNSVANPYQSDVQFRGFTASPLLGTPQGLSVYLDGVRVNEPFGDIVNWDLIPANAIANINLIPGSNPLFGLNTLGGALSVHTKSGEQFPGVKVSALTGSWKRKNFEAEAGGVNKEMGMDYFLATNLFGEEGWREHSRSEVNQVFGKIGWQNDKSDLDFSFAVANTDLEGTQAVPLSELSNPKKAYTYPDSIGNNMTLLSLKGSHFLADDKLIAGNVYYRTNRITGFNSNAQVDDASPGTIVANNISTTTDQDGYGASLQLTLLGDLAGHKNQFTAGSSVDLGRTDFSSDSLQANLVGHETVTDSSLTGTGIVRLKTKNDYYGLYATDTFSWTDQLHMTLSGRYNIAKIKLNGFSDDQQGGGNNDLHGDHRYSRFNPAIGFNYNPNNDLGFFGGYNEGMRTATPVELSCADETKPCQLPNAFASDPHLQKVVAKTWEGGARGKLLGNWGWNAGVYTTTNSNDIQFISSSTPSQGYFQNVGDTRRRGLELGLNGKFDALTLAVNYGFVDATYQSDFEVASASNSTADTTSKKIQVTKGNKIPGIARQTLKMRAAYDLTEAWNVGANLVAATGQYARGDENNQDVNGKVPGYAVVNLDTHYRLHPNWQLFAKVNNLFDKKYSTFGVLGNNIFANGGAGADEQFRSPAAPLAGWIGVTYEFGTKKSAVGVDND